MLEEMQSKDLELIVSSGAVSVGDFDFVRETLERMGAEILYHRIGIRPGKPNLLARFSSGGLYFGLPGNPVATAVGLRFLVAPVVRKMQGRAIEQPVMARALNAFQKKPGIHFFLKAVAHVTDEGQLAVMLMAGQESFKVHPFLGLNGWVVLSDTDTDVQEGDSLLFYPAFPDEGILITE
ncbi:MAG: molybdopterin-binding protein [Gammaproteobacteria bacterium]